MRNNKGQALVEYILIIALVSFTLIALVKYFGGYLKDYITKQTCSMVSQEYIEGDKPGEGVCEDKK